MPFPLPLRPHWQRLLLATLAIGLAATALSEEPMPAPLFPFLISYDGPDNASSVAHLLDAPAGKHGFVRVENGRFVNDAGPVRLHGTNLTGPANFPTHEQADKLAARLARFGLNCVRLHYMDADYGNFRNPAEPGILADDATTQRRLAPEQIDRLDYLIAALKRRGIYVDVNLHVARYWDERDGFPDRNRRPWADKGLDNFEPRMIALQKEYARDLLTHINPYTELTYANDPAVAVIELNNENALFNQYFGGGLDRLSEPYAGEFRRQWNEWLCRQYKSSEAVRAAWRWEAVPLSDEQIPDGTFATPLAMDGKQWTFSLGTAQATAESGEGVLKIAVTRDGNEYFPKLFRRLEVKRDEPYTLTFRIRRTDAKGKVRLGLAVADTVDGWRSLGIFRTLQVGDTWQTVSQAFVAGDDSPQAQLQITRFKTGTYEIADLSFQHGMAKGFDPGSRIEDGTVPTFKSSDVPSRQARLDFCRFLYDTEQAYWTGLADYLRQELGVRVPISGTQLGYSPPAIQAELDYVDNHSYWCHPSPVSPNWEIANVSMVSSLACIRGLAAQRVLDKPYTVSEYNHPFPNQYGAEGQPMLRAYGSFQGWDGVFEYTYNHRSDFEPTANTYFFSMIARTDVLAHIPACAAIFLRGDVREGTTTVVGSLSPETYLDRLATRNAIRAELGAAGLDSHLGLLHKTAMDLTGNFGTKDVPAIADGQKVFVSDTGELTWNTEEPGAGYFVVDTPNTKLFTGFPKGRTIALGNVTLAVGETRLGWATVSLVSRQATGFGERPASILLAATGLAENHNMVAEDLGNHHIRLREPWGEGSVWVEGVPATLQLPVPSARVRWFALDPAGQRKQELPVEAADGSTRLVLKPEYQTVWYEIAIQ